MKKNVAGQKIGAQLVSATDGSAFTGSVTVSVTVDAGTQATGSVGSGACTHEGNGYHTYAPAQAETNGDLVAFTFTGTGAVPVTVQVYTRPTTGLLAPTVADRTLDVSATGEAGIDWANVGSPSSTVSLSATTVATVTTTTTATNVTTVNGLAANVITAASAAADFGTEVGTAVWATAARTLTAATNITSTGGSVPITAGGLVSADVTAISTDTVAANNCESFFDGTGYAGTNNVIPLVTTTTTATNVTTVNGLATGVITAAAIAADAIGASELAADAVAEIADAVWDELQSGHVAAGSFGEIATEIADILVDTSTTLQAELDGIQADTEDIQSRLPAALVGGRIDATVDGTGLEAGALALINAEVDTALADINLDHLVKNAVDTNFATTVHLDSVVGHLADAGTTATFDRTTDSLEVLGAATAPSAATIADAVWDEALSGHLSAGSTGEALNAAGSAGDPWTTTLPGSYTGSQAGKILSDILVDTGTTLQSELDGIQADTEDIQSRLPAALVSGRIDASVGAMAANVLTAAATASDFGTEVGTAVWATTTRELTGAANITSDGLAVPVDLSTGLVKCDVRAIDGTASTTLAGFKAMSLAYNAGTLTTNVTGNITGNLSGSVGSVTGTIGGLSAAALADFFDTNSGTTYASAVAGSVVKEIADNAGGSGLTAAGIADAVWDEVISGHLTAGTTGAKLNSAASAGDPLSNEVPGSYAGGTAGYALGQIGSGTVTFSGPVIEDDDTFEIIQGDDYLIVDSRSLNWTFGASPNLTGATVVMRIQTPTVTELTGTKSGEGTSSQLVKFEMTRTLTASFYVKSYAFDIQATLSDGSVITLVRSTFLVRSQVA